MTVIDRKLTSSLAARKSILRTCGAPDPNNPYRTTSSRPGETRRYVGQVHMKGSVIKHMIAQ